MWCTPGVLVFLSLIDYWIGSTVIFYLFDFFDSRHIGFWCEASFMEVKSLTQPAEDRANHKKNNVGRYEKYR